MTINAARAYLLNLGWCATRCYLERMTRFVIEPLVLLALTDGGNEVDPLHQLVAPNSIRSAHLELLFQRVCAGLMSEAQALEAHERATALKIRLLGDRVSRRTAWNMAQEQGWPNLHHAEYLAITRLQADALVALDPVLIAHARELVEVAPLALLYGD